MDECKPLPFVNLPACSSAEGHMYDKVSEAIHFRALAHKFQLNILELKNATSIIRRDMASFDSRILS